MVVMLADSEVSVDPEKAHRRLLPCALVENRSCMGFNKSATSITIH